MIFNFEEFKVVIVEEIQLHYPDREKMEEWKNEALDSFLDENWIGRPDYSVELHPVNSGQPLEAQTFSRLEDMAIDFEVFAAFRDVGVGEWEMAKREDGFLDKRYEIEKNMSEGFWDMGVYLSRLHEASSMDINAEFFQTEAELGYLRPSMSVCEELEDLIVGSDDFALTGAGLEGMYESDMPSEALDGFEDVLAFHIYFMYSGDQDAVEKYNEHTSGYGDDNRYSGVPGMITVGSDENSRVHMPLARKLGISYSDIEKDLGSRIGNILAAREDIEN